MNTAASDFITPRELYATLGQAEAKTVGAIADLKTEIRHLFELHEQAHAADEARRAARGRWMVGTALTIGGLGGGFLGHVIERLLG